ncbi:G-protein coupled receptor [Macrophomina phaseolina MS6]|uniref:G-protein coupled receptor n=1 Tax=Macrophomina phaseolina (strain MS6) TaxID=1126212 RepID=K2SDJ5_MACPH|nr:G-protein coupled receptor [Macrophomina phaseolina MS6]
MLTSLVLFIATGMKILLQTIDLKRGAYGFDEPITVLQVGTPFVPPNHVVRFTEVRVTESYAKEEKPGMTTAITAPENCLEGNPNQIEVAAPRYPEAQPVVQDLEKWPSAQESQKEGETYGASGSTTSTARPLMSARWLPGISSLGRWRPGHLSWGDPRAVHALRAAEAYAKISILVFLSVFAIHTPAGANRVYMISHDGQPHPIATHFHAALNPSQGFLDAVIYVAMSWPQMEAIFRDALESIHRKREKRWRRRQNARELVQ